jgi:PHP family Zn ribbon phosphoesterase
MELAVDLHIHSVLSPCSNRDMTPNNIINMSLLKGLDIIAVADHNTAGNAETVLKCARSRSIMAVPGMEVETMEEVHILCLFPNLEAVVSMEELVYESLPSIKNREEIFGE